MHVHDRDTEETELGRSECALSMNLRSIRSSGLRSTSPSSRDWHMCFFRIWHFVAALHCPSHSTSNHPSRVLRDWVRAAQREFKGAALPEANPANAQIFFWAAFPKCSAQPARNV